MTDKEKNTEAEQSIPVLWIAGILLILGLAIAGGLYWHHTGKVEKVRFTGNHYTTKKELQKQVHIPHGISPDSLDMAGIRKKLEKLPYVKYARINFSMDGTLTIKITEATPVALLMNGSHRAYITDNGIRLKQKLGKTPDVPILYGFRVRPMSDTLQSKAFKKTSRFLQDLRKNKAADATISEVTWNAKKGLIALTNDNGVKVIFGKGNYNDRLRNWKAFYREVIRSKGIKQFHSVDLRFKGQIVTREN